MIDTSLGVTSEFVPFDFFCDLSPEVTPRDVSIIKHSRSSAMRNRILPTDHPFNRRHSGQKAKKDLRVLGKRQSTILTGNRIGPPRSVRISGGMHCRERFIIRHNTHDTLTKWDEKTYKLFTDGLDVERNSTRSPKKKFKLQMRVQAGAATLLVKIKAHRGDPLNEEADIRAEMGHHKEQKEVRWNSPTNRTIREAKWCKEHIPRKGNDLNDLTDEGISLLDDMELWWGKQNLLWVCHAPRKKDRMNINGTFLSHQKGAISGTFTRDWYLRKGASRDKMGEWLKKTTVRSQDPWRMLHANTHSFPLNYWRHNITKVKESNRCDLWRALWIAEEGSTRRTVFLFKL
jgi:hypothetical protein